MRFYLGTHQPYWLSAVGFPLFVSRRRLEKYKTLPTAAHEWALDSGAFTEISKFGRWTITLRQYVAMVRRFRDEIGKMEWAAPMDWMCEPTILEKTKATVQVHQRRTVRNYVALMETAPDVNWIPVLQGWSPGDYQRCIELYRLHRVELDKLPLVGLGSVCRRQGETRIALLVEDLARQGLKLHGFGIKLKGIALCGHALASSDSMAWSFDARRKGNYCGSDKHKNCANCIVYATEWRDRAIRVSSGRARDERA